MAVPRRSGISRRDLLALGAAAWPGLRLAAQGVTFSTDVRVVNVLASVRDRDGHIVKNLEKEKFKLEEDGKTQQIKYFSQQTDLGLTFGLLVDTSGSQRLVLGEERRASSQFLRRVLREDKDVAFVIQFDREVTLTQDLTSSRRDLERGLSGIDAEQSQRRRGWGGGPGGPIGGPGRFPRPAPNSQANGTSLYDAVLLASDELMRKQPGRKALILLSDGVDQGSKVSLNRAIEAAQRADTLVYSILFSSAGAFRVRRGGFGGLGGVSVQLGGTTGAKVLQRISRESGGNYFAVTEKLTLEDIYRQIEDELRNQYNLGYTPASTSNGYRKIKVSVNQKGLIVQAREGYYVD
jgi:VWFA-related protein